jgi:hypothetical protein
MGKVIVVEQPGLDLEPKDVAIVLEPFAAAPFVGEAGFTGERGLETLEFLRREIRGRDLFAHMA